MIDYIFNPFDMATHGLLSGNSFTTAVQGHLTIIEIEIVPPRDRIKLGGGLGTSTLDKKQKYKITVKLFKDGEMYVETKTVTMKHEPKVSNIQVKLSNKNKIKISVKKN